MQPVPQEQHQHQDGRRRRTQQGQGDILGLSAGTFHGVSSLVSGFMASEQMTDNECSVSSGSEYGKCNCFQEDGHPDPVSNGRTNLGTLFREYRRVCVG